MANNGSGKAQLRSKQRKKINRYNPNAPDWRAVHIPGLLGKLGLLRK